LANFSTFHKTDSTSKKEGRLYIAQPELMTLAKPPLTIATLYGNPSMPPSIYRNLTATVLLTLGLLVLPPAFATEPPIQPKAGLWQVSSQTTWFDRVVPDVGKIIRMGPERLQTHIDNMLRQNHVRLNDDGTAALCVNEKQIASNVYVNDQGSGCTVAKGRRIGRILFFQIQCDAPSGSGLTTVKLLDSEHWEATTQLIVTVRGVAQHINNYSRGTWQSAECSF
jgi:hypothetical protein